MKTIEERRLDVLNDAITQIRANKIIAQPGVVVEIPFEATDRTEAKPVLEEFFKKEQAIPCDACARGTLLLCTVHKENNFLLSDFNLIRGPFKHGSVVDNRLAELFSEEQLIMMENAFEVENCESREYFDEDDYPEDYYGINHEYLDEDLARECVEFGLKYSDANERLLAIFENAIANGGEFKP